MPDPQAESALTTQPPTAPATETSGRTNGVGSGTSVGTSAPTTVVPAAPERVNPFKAIGFLLESVNDGLAGAKRPGTAPRWVRIVRVRQFATVTATGALEMEGATNALGKGVLIATSGFSRLIAEMLRFTLAAKDILIQGDAIKALVEVSGDLIKTATSKDFIDSLTAIADLQVDASSFSAMTGDVVDKAMKYVDKVPEPEDIDAIGSQLYKLLAIERFADGGEGAAQAGEIDIDRTGKVRLMQWGLGQPMLIYAGKTGTPIEVRRLGARDLTEAQPSDKVAGEWQDETMFEIGFALPDGTDSDIGEAIKILEALGYVTPAVASRTSLSDPLQQQLRQFQKLNALPVTGALDVRTVHQLMNLDSDRKQIRRAKPYDATKLAGFDDTKNPLVSQPA